MAVRPRHLLLGLVILFLFASTHLEARELLRYAPPSGTDPGIAKVTLRTDEGQFVVTEGAGLANGDVSVTLELDEAETLLTTTVDILDAQGGLVDTYPLTVGWPTESIEVRLDWSDGRGGTDTLEASFHASSGAEFQDGGASDVTVAGDQARRELAVVASESGTMTVRAYHPAIGEVHVVEGEDAAAGDTILCSYLRASETLLVSAVSFPTETRQLRPGSLITSAFTGASGLVVVATYVGR